MTIFNLADYSDRTRFEGDYVGDLAAEMSTTVMPSNWREGIPLKDKFAFLGPAFASTTTWRKATTTEAPNTPQAATLIRPATGYHIRHHDGGGGQQMSFPIASEPRIKAATVATENVAEPGWRTVSNYKGFLVQEYRSHLQRPLYRGVWGPEATPPRANPQDTHQDIDRTAEKPRVEFTRNLPGAKGVPDSMRATVNTAAQAAWNRLGQRLARIRKEWGPVGHVETYHGVRIFRGKRNIKAPDGKKITVPFYYTKQKLKGVNNGQAPLEGYLAADQGMNNNLAMVDGPAEAETLDDMKAIIDTHPLKEGVAPALDEGPGPAAGTIEVQALPGEAGTAPENTMLSDPKNKTKTTAAIGAAAVLAYFFMG